MSKGDNSKNYIRNRVKIQEIFKDIIKRF